jgi:hypothetical protein
VRIGAQNDDFDQGKRKVKGVCRCQSSDESKCLATAAAMVLLFSLLLLLLFWVAFRLITILSSPYFWTIHSVF